MPDYFRRALRTFIQSWVGVFIASGVLSAASETGVVDWSSARKAALSAGAAGIVAVLTLVQNLLEDTTRFPAVGKAPASEGENPVPGDAGQADLVTICVVIIAVIALLWAFGVVPE
jgi:hypothetical protein